VLHFSDTPGVTALCCLPFPVVSFVRFLCVLGAACTVIGGLDGLLETILTCTLQTPQYVSAVSRFDLVILVCLSILYRT